MTSILGHLEWVYEWVSLESRCVNVSYLVDISPYSNSLIYSHKFRQVPSYLFKNISPRTTLSIGTAFQPLWWMITANRRFRNQYLMTFQKLSASKDAFKKRFPQNTRDWNDLPDSLISSTELLDDCVTSLV